MYVHVWGTTCRIQGIGNGFDTFFFDGVIVLVFDIEFFKLVLILKESIVEARSVAWAEECDILLFKKAFIHELIELYAVIEVTDTVYFNATIVFKHEE